MNKHWGAKLEIWQIFRELPQHIFLIGNMFALYQIWQGIYIPTDDFKFIWTNLFQQNPEYHYSTWTTHLCNSENRILKWHKTHYQSIFCKHTALQKERDICIGAKMAGALKWNTACQMIVTKYRSLFNDFALKRTELYFQFCEYFIWEGGGWKLNCTVH